MDFAEHFLKPKKRATQDPFAQLRQVPGQPSETPEGFVYLGEDIGMVRIGDRKPQAGEMTVIVGSDKERIALAGATPRPLEHPVFTPGGCKCKCQNSGLIFYLTPVRWTTNLIVLDTSTGATIYHSLLPDVLRGEGIAVDPDSPNNLYIMDNRFVYETLKLADTPTGQDPAITWYFLLTYTLTGNSYTFQSANVLPGGPDGINPVGIEPVVDDFAANALSVIDGVVYISRNGPPASFYTWNGSSFGTLTLTEDGSPAPYRVQGQIVQSPDRPSPTRSLFVATLDGELIQFMPDGAIQKVVVFDDADLSLPANAVAMCNRLYFFNGNIGGRDELAANLEPGEGGEES